MNITILAVEIKHHVDSKGSLLKLRRVDIFCIIVFDPVDEPNTVGVVGARSPHDSRSARHVR